jgi:hypothetical protein
MYTYNTCLERSLAGLSSQVFHVDPHVDSCSIWYSGKYIGRLLASVKKGASLQYFVSFDPQRGYGQSFLVFSFCYLGGSAGPPLVIFEKELH